MAAAEESSEEEPERRITEFLGRNQKLDDILDRGLRRRRAWLHNIVDADDGLFG
jgi:hypothetical protein